MLYCVHAICKCIRHTRLAAGAYHQLVQLRTTLIVSCWIVFVVIWIGAGVIFRPESRDPSARPRLRLRERSFGLLLAALIVFAIRTHHLGGTGFGHALGWLGVVLCAAGIGLAAWARVCLGRNWGMPMTVRAQPTLVIRGPYRVVRHPIYSGLLLAMIGSALARGPVWLAATIGAGAYFVISLRVEESDMAALFPNDYPEYARHTKRLIPFLY
jgi:protein-S-isoprenylcysteine O-methyltransferase Ste14